MDSIDYTKLKALQGEFLNRYPWGFESPDLHRKNKNDNIQSIMEFSQKVFAKQEFLEPLLVVENMIKVVNSSSVSSFFEKPRFKNYIQSLSATRQVEFAEGLKRLLHGKEEKGFNIMLNILAEGDLSKWSLISTFAAFYAPSVDVFIKPTRVKKILTTCNIKNISYKSKPSWDFYHQYRKIINEMKSELNPSLSPNNFAFCDFLAIESFSFDS